MPPSFLAYVIVRYRHNLTIKLLPKQEGAGFPTPSILYSAYFVLLFNVGKPSHQLFSSHLLLSIWISKASSISEITWNKSNESTSKSSKVDSSVTSDASFQVLQR